ncbi:penicillin acylase family protein [Embleya sp. NPDC020630]|uniref:penicillin acylase family protein n=1 Tax=Embleya sp. NPDC020630 TaxID=3363979 RepID=UPI00378E900E
MPPSKTPDPEQPPGGQDASSSGWDDWPTGEWPTSQWAAADPVAAQRRAEERAERERRAAPEPYAEPEPYAPQEPGQEQEPYVQPYVPQEPYAPRQDPHPAQEPHAGQEPYALTESPAHEEPYPPLEPYAEPAAGSVPPPAAAPVPPAPRAAEPPPAAPAPVPAPIPAPAPSPSAETGSTAEPAPASAAPGAPADTEAAEPAAGGTGKVKERSNTPKGPSKAWRRFRLTAIVFVVVLAIAAGGLGWWGWQLSRDSFPQTSGTVRIAGLTGKVDVVRDAQGIPQVYADTSEDLFRGQGYVHAQDRFWEMDVRRHMTAGRLSEMFGSGQVDNDKFLRTLGWRKVAEQEYAALAPESQKFLQAYADGVNAYLKDHKGADASFEYALLGLVHDGYKAEPWTPVDSVAWLKAMAWDLRTNMQDEIDRALLSDKLTVNRIDELYPPYPYDTNKPIVRNGDIVKDGKTERFAQDAPPPAPSKNAQSALANLSESLSKLPSLFSEKSSGVGSNSWVVAGSRTTTGKPLLANDPHLSPSLPSVWYQMGLHCRAVGPQCQYDVSGYTFSGMPGVIIGHNQKISWGFTNLGADVTDLYLEKVQGDGVLYDSKWEPFKEVRQETIKVAGGADRRITVRTTRHGPILTDAVDESDDLKQVGKDAPIPDLSPQREDGYAVALRWTALDPGSSMDALFQLDRAQNWNDFRAALKNFDAPSQNAIYADVEGHIGYQAPGKIPLRRSGDGRWPVYGWDPKYDWLGTIPFESLPNVYDPQEGYIVTANNAVTSPAYPYLLTSDWGYGARSARIEEMITKAPGKIDPAMMQKMQVDDVNPVAQFLVPALLAVRIDDPWVREAQDLLKDWDKRNDADSTAAAYFNAVWRQVLMLAFGDKMPFSVRADNDCASNADNTHVQCGDRDDSTAQPDGGDRWNEVVRTLLATPESPWWNISKNPGAITTRDGLLHKAMTEAKKDLTARLGKDIDTWSWGRLHTLTLRNQTLGTGGPGVVKWMLNRGPYGMSGGEGLVNATGWNAAQGYEVTTVPSMRMVVDMSDLDASRWINLTGASGHVWHDNYTDQTDLWRKGKTLPWAFTPAAVDKAAKHRLTLLPAGPAAPGKA